MNLAVKSRRAGPPSRPVRSRGVPRGILDNPESYLSVPGGPGQYPGICEHRVSSAEPCYGTNEATSEITTCGATTRHAGVEGALARRIASPE